MSDGLNKLFLANPLRFFETHIVETNSFMNQIGNGPRMLTFTRTDKSGFRNSDKKLFETLPVVTLTTYQRKDICPSRSMHKYSHPLNLYWLQFSNVINLRGDKGVSSITLESTANFFISYQITGCRIEVGQGLNPTILHIAGDYPNERMDQIAIDRLGESRMSQYFVIDDGPGSPCVGLFYGIRDQNSGIWSFYTQGLDYNIDPQHICYTRRFVNRAFP